MSHVGFEKSHPGKDQRSHQAGRLASGEKQGLEQKPGEKWLGEDQVGGRPSWVGGHHRDHAKELRYYAV